MTSTNVERWNIFKTTSVYYDLDKWDQSWIFVSFLDILLTDSSFYLYSLRFWREVAESCSVDCPHPKHVPLSCHQTMADKPGEHMTDWLDLSF